MFLILAGKYYHLLISIGTTKAKTTSSSVNLRPRRQRVLFFLPSTPVRPSVGLHSSINNVWQWNMHRHVSLYCIVRRAVLRKDYAITMVKIYEKIPDRATLERDTRESMWFLTEEVVRCHCQSWKVKIRFIIYLKTIRFLLGGLAIQFLDYHNHL